MGGSSGVGEGRVYRLVGDVEGVRREYILVPGDHQVGSSAENDITVEAPDVSRRHAIIRVNSEKIHLEDLRSTNGTFVNGVQVARSDLAANDWIQFGSVLLTIERVANDDLALGIELEPPPGNGTDDHPAERTTQLGRTRDRYSRRMALANETVAHILGARDGAVGDALDVFREGLGADAAALLEIDEGRAATIHLAAGQVAALDEHRLRAELARMRIGTPDGIAGGFVPSSEPMIVVARRVDRFDHDVMVVCGGNLDEDLVPVCELVFRTILHAAPIARRDAPDAEDALPLVFPAGHVQGHSEASQKMYRQITALRNSMSPVLVVGETGVGKEHVARIFHASSDRKDGPLRVLNCAAIPADLLEAELFGIEAGVATGVDHRTGAFRDAHGGILFFDEIGAMPLPLQAKLLRALQEEEVHPVGAKCPVKVCVRIVAATNADLAAAIEDGSFRRDLYYRLAGCEIHVPPLRRRREDIPALVRALLGRCAADAGKTIRGLSVRALSDLQNASWPGNVRQLEHEIRRLVSVCPSGATIESSMISTEIAAALPPDDEIPSGELDLRRHVDALERRLIRLAVNQADGNLARAARLLGLSRNGLVLKMGRLGIGRS